MIMFCEYAGAYLLLKAIDAVKIIAENAECIKMGNGAFWDYPKKEVKFAISSDF